MLSHADRQYARRDLRRARARSHGAPVAACVRRPGPAVRQVPLGPRVLPGDLRRDHLDSRRHVRCEPHPGHDFDDAVGRVRALPGVICDRATTVPRPSTSSWRPRSSSPAGRVERSERGAQGKMAATAGALPAAAGPNAAPTPFVAAADPTPVAAITPPPLFDQRPALRASRSQPRSNQRSPHSQNAGRTRWRRWDGASRAKHG